MAQILIDLRWMIPGYTGGAEILARQLVNTLPRLETRHEYSLLLPLVTRYDFDLRPNFRLQICDGPGSYVDKLIWRAKDRRARREGEALKGVWVNGRQVEYDAAISPLGLIHPDLHPLKNLLIVHDLQHEFLPQLFSERELQNRRRDFDASIGQAGQIVTISQFSRRTFIDHYRLAPEMVSVAYGAAEPLFHQPVPKPEETWDKYGLSKGGYLFYPANTWPHKNHVLALAAIKILGERYQRTVPLVCTGAPKEAHAGVLAEVEALGLQDQFRFLGYCPRRELPALYHGAAALVFPSLYEGFGLPILEAMWCDCPVICSNVTSLPEVAGPAALYFDPQDASGLAEAVQQVLEDPALRSSMIEKGRQQASQFSWEQFAGVILGRLDVLLGETGPERWDRREDLMAPAIQNSSPTQSSRIARSRDLLLQAAEYRRLGRHWEALGKLIPGMLLGPDVAFNLLWFPWLRDRVLRKLLAKLKV